MISHQGNATQNHSEILLHVRRMTERKSKQVLVRVVEKVVVEKLELSYISGEVLQLLWKTSGSFSRV